MLALSMSMSRVCVPFFSPEGVALYAELTPDGTRPFHTDCTCMSVHVCCSGCCILALELALRSVSWGNAVIS
jgi:hypothetical protein